MIVTDIQGNLFDNLQDGDVIAHGANCLGFMGAGVAKEIKRRFPENYKVYNKACKNDLFLPGNALGVYENGILVYNLGTQYNTGADAHIVNIRTSVRSMLNQAVASRRYYKPVTKIKTVRLGCGIGGLDWADVKPELESIHADVELEVYYI